MTIICAYTNGKYTWLGSDTVSILERRGSLCPVPVACKWVIHNGWAYGQAGDAVVAEWVCHTARKLMRGLNVNNAAIVFPARLQDIYLSLKMQDWSNNGILACAGAVWSVNGDLSCKLLPSRQMHAVGCGALWAIGAAWGFQQAKPEADPETLMDVALGAAAQFDMQIRGKWTGKL